MDKEELIYLTLQQLEDSLNETPHRLSLDDPEIGNGQFPGSTIFWKPTVEIDGKITQESGNIPSTVMVSYNKLYKQISAHIFFREVNSLNSAMIADASAYYCYKYWPRLYRSFRLFMRIRAKLIAMHQDKHRMDFVKKLMTLFPGAGDKDLLK